ncbi:hypothetical protein ACQ86G_30195 [Roseateles chitinivorans]|uniref:hypothetical protein n=1 Tax=Roseateles chitinivorans TaxID=2917965 RepID=UPI003D67121E
MSEAMELTTFQLAKGTTIKQFIAANADIDAWLQRQPGFILRRLCEGQDGWVIDMLLWRSARDGQRAAAGVMSELSDSPVHAAINPSTVDWTIQPCRHRLG